MVQVQNIALQPPPRMESCPSVDSHNSSLPYAVTSTDMGIPVAYRPIPGDFAFKNLQVTTCTTPSGAEPSPASEDATSKHTHTRWVAAYTAQLMKRSRRMVGPANLAQRKPACEVLEEYICALSRKKEAVLSLAEVQVDCEESEAVLLEAYGIARLKQILNDHFAVDDPLSATGRYFDAVSNIRFDPIPL